MSVYVSNTDETASAHQSGKFLIAGYVAVETEWPDFSRHWYKEVLEPSPSIPYLHMVEIRSERWRKDHGISRAEAEEKVHAAVHLISNTDYITGYFAQISEPCYVRSKKKLEAAAIKSKPHHNEIDYLCFIAYALSVTNYIALEQPSARKVIFNISKKKYISHYIEHSVQRDMLEGLKELRPHLAQLFGDVVPLSMEDHMPLQAADTLGWHLQRTYSGPEAEDKAVRECTAILQQKELTPINVPDSVIEMITDNLIRSIKQRESENDGAR